MLERKKVKHLTKLTHCIKTYKTNITRVTMIHCSQRHLTIVYNKNRHASTDIYLGQCWRRKIEASRMGLDMEKGVPSPADYRVWGSVVSSPSGVEVEPWPETHFGVFWRPQNAPFCTYVLMLWVRQTLFHVTFGGTRQRFSVRYFLLLHSRTVPKFKPTTCVNW